MDCIKIRGGRELSGSVFVQGSKNAALPLISASVLVKGKCVLKNCPNLSDTRAAVQILEFLGAKCQWDKNTLIIDSENIENKKIDPYLMGKLRSSITFAGALLGRFGETALALPGGCELGPRPIDMHIAAFERLGIKSECSGGYITLCGKPEGASIVLPFPSVGATQNAMLAAVCAKGDTTIVNSAREPEIICLQNFLNEAGAKISGAGGAVIHITGTESLKPAEFRIDSDRIAAATYIACALSSGGGVSLYGVCCDHMSAILSAFGQMGADIVSGGEKITVLPQKRLLPVMADTQPYPGFPTDALPLMTALAAKAKGTSIFSENIFKNRFRHTDELAKLGADVRIFGKTCVIQGKEKLSGARVDACDLRGGASMVIAGLGAEGETVIESPHYLDRGYENMCEILEGLGADITRENI